MRKLSAILIILLLGSLCFAAKSIPYGATKQHFTVVMRNITGEPCEYDVIANMDLYAIKDGNAISTKIDLAAATCKNRTLGVYEVDIPDNWTNGTWATYGDSITFIVDDANAANPFRYAYYEVQISPPVDVNTVCREVPIDDGRLDTLDASINGLRADVNTANTEITTASGYASDAKAASELIDTRDELLTLLTGGTLDLATEPNLTLVLADTSAVDTRNELLTLLTGGTLDLATEVNETTILGRIPASVALHTDPNDALQSRGYTSTVSGRIDMKISDVNDLGYTVTTTVDPNSIVDKLLTGHDIPFSLAWWLKRCAESAGIPW